MDPERLSEFLEHHISHLGVETPTYLVPILTVLITTDSDQSQSRLDRLRLIALCRSLSHRLRCSSAFWKPCTRFLCSSDGSFTNADDAADRTRECNYKIAKRSRVAARPISTPRRLRHWFKVRHSLLIDIPAHYPLGIDEP